MDGTGRCHPFCDDEPVQARAEGVPVRRRSPRRRRRSRTENGTTLDPGDGVDAGAPAARRARPLLARQPAPPREARRHRDRVGHRPARPRSSRGARATAATPSSRRTVELSRGARARSRRADALAELLAKAERDCFVGASLTAKPSYRWTVNGAALVSARAAPSSGRAPRSSSQYSSACSRWPDQTVARPALWIVFGELHALVVADARQDAGEREGDAFERVVVVVEHDHEPRASESASRRRDRGAGARAAVTACCSSAPW